MTRLRITSDCRSCHTKLVLAIKIVEMYRMRYFLIFILTIGFLGIPYANGIAEFSRSVEFLAGRQLPALEAWSADINEGIRSFLDIAGVLFMGLHKLLSFLFALFSSSDEPKFIKEIYLWTEAFRAALYAAFPLDHARSSDFSILLIRAVVFASSFTLISRGLTVVIDKKLDGHWKSLSLSLLLLGGLIFVALEIPPYNPDYEAWNLLKNVLN